MSTKITYTVTSQKTGTLTDRYAAALLLALLDAFPVAQVQVIRNDDKSGECRMVETHLTRDDLGAPTGDIPDARSIVKSVRAIARLILDKGDF